MAGSRTRGALLLVGALLVVGVGVVRANRRSAPLAVEFVRVEKGDVRETIASAAAAEVRAARRVILRAEVAGTVARLPKTRGARVERGELLAAFSSDDLAARVEQARANLDAADVAVRVAETRLDVAEKARIRAVTLAEGGALSSADRDRAEGEARSARHAVDQAKATRLQAVAALRLATITVDRATVRAPFAGILQDVLVDLGVQVAPGSGLIDLIDDAELVVDVPVDEGDAARVEVGQAVRVEVDPGRHVSIEGQVRFIPPALGKKSGATVDPTQALKRDAFLYVEVVPSTREGLRVGATVNAEILISRRPDVLFVPTSVVVGRGVDRKVWRVRDGVAQLVGFKPGLTSWDRTEVVSGLEPGDTLVATLNAKGLRDGVPVAEAVK